MCSRAYRLPARARPTTPARARYARGAWKSARLLLAVAFLGASALAGVARSRAAAPPTLYVFLQTDVKATVFEKELQAKLPRLAVTVFGRFRDLEEALVNRRPDALLAIAPLLEAKGLVPSLRGINQGQELEKYVVVSAGAPLEGPLSNRVIGAVDLLGRKETQAFVASLLAVPDIKTKLVTKREDLLSLLQFAAADAVLLPARAIKNFTDRSRLSLHVRELSNGQVGRVAVATLSAATAAVVVQQIEGLDRETNELMGVDGWRKR